MGRLNWILIIVHGFATSSIMNNVSLIVNIYHIDKVILAKTYPKSYHLMISSQDMSTYTWHKALWPLLGLILAVVLSGWLIRRNKWPFINLVFIVILAILCNKLIMGTVSKLLLSPLTFIDDTAIRLFILGNIYFLIALLLFFSGKIKRFIDNKGGKNI